LQIAEVAVRGAEVFEDKNKFLIWMNSPNKALADKTPMSLLSSRFGTDMVLDELGRIEHGVLSWWKVIFIIKNNYYFGFMGSRFCSTLR
jgi:putative toxin-antitoxin system antitoxin component (TIGR02293 family)